MSGLGPPFPSSAVNREYRRCGAVGASIRALTLALLYCSAIALTACETARDCERTWESSSPSVDRAWIAVAHEDACKLGIVSDLSVAIELRAKGDSVGQAILWPSGQWTQPHPIQLHWLSERQLEVVVPNRTMFENSIWRYKGVDVEVRYERDDLRDRERWLEWVKQNQVWLKLRDNTPQPQPPPISEPDAQMGNTTRSLAANRPAR